MRHCLEDWKSLLTHRALLVEMSRRELSSRYAGSAAGILWAYLQPILMVATYFLVFDVVFAMRLGDSAPTQRVGAYLVVGALPWLAFCEAVSRGASSLVDAGTVLHKNALPPVLFVARSVLAGMAVFMPLMLFLSVGYVAFNGLHASVVALPALLLLQVVLIFLLAHALAILTAAARDVLQVLAFALSVGIYLSPVLFPISLFPEPWRWVLYLNPMTALVMGYQAVLLQGQWPSSAGWLVALAWIFFLAALLNRVAGRSRDQLVDWL